MEKGCTHTLAEDSLRANDRLYRALYRQKKEKIPATLPAVDDLLSDPDKTAHEVWTDMITYLHENGATIPIVAKAARDQLNRPEEEAGSVLSTTLSYLTIYRDPVVANNVSRSDFRIRDLMHSEEPVTLYIVTEPVDKQRLQPLVRVLVNMIVRLSATGLSFEGGMPKPNYRHRLLHNARSPAFLPGTASKLISSRKTSTSSTLTMGAMKQSPRLATCNVRLHPTASKPLNTFQN